MSSQLVLGTIDARRKTSRQVASVRWLLPIGWCLAAVGFCGPWVEHHTAALTLSGADMGEFVKFLPGALDGSLKLVRQFFYLPPFATLASLALLVNAPSLGYHRLMRVLGLVLAIPLSLQLLPPAWSPSALVAAEFRIQTLGLVISWLLLASSLLLRRLPVWLAGLASAVLCSSAVILNAWQFQLVAPAIDLSYSTAHGTGWGLVLCLVGMGICVVASALLALTSHPWLKTHRAGDR